MNKSANPVTLYPYGLISRHGTPKTLGYYMLHEGLIGYLGNDGLQEITYKKIEEKKVMNFNVTDGWFGITDKYWAATLLPDTKAHLKARFSTGKLGGKETYQTDYLLDARTVAPGASTTVEGAPVRRRQGSARHQRLREAAQPQPLRPADRLGLVLLHHQAAVHGDRLVLQAGRQFRRRHPDRHGADQGRVLPARQQVLRLDGQDEGGAAADDRAARALSRRQGQAAAGADGALQEGEDQSGGRLSADRHPDPGVLLALQGAVRHHRDAARAVLRLDPRPVGARPDQRLHAVRAASIATRRRCRWSATSCISACGR